MLAVSQEDDDVVQANSVLPFFWVLASTMVYCCTIIITKPLPASVASDGARLLSSAGRLFLMVLAAEGVAQMRSGD